MSINNPANPLKKSSCELGSPPEFNGEIYSNEEVRIGTWVDGKPLYRRVIEITTPSTRWVWTVLAGYTGIDRIVGFYGSMIGGYSPAPYQAYVSPCLSIGTTSDNELQICLEDENYKNLPSAIILEYTKTTG